MSDKRLQPSERFTFAQYADGQIYVREGDREMLHAEVRGEHDVEIQLTSNGRVAIDKLYGPLIMWPIRVRIDYEECEWVVERGDGPTETWREVARIPGQLDSDFTDHGEDK